MYLNLKLSQNEKLEIPILHHSMGTPQFVMISFNVILYSTHDILMNANAHCSRLMPINV